MKLSFLGVLVMTALLLSGCQPRGGSFERIDLDAQRHFVLGKPLAQPPTSGSYYDWTHGAFIDGVDHVRKEVGGTAKMALSMSTGTDRRLLEALRHEVVLRGPFGIVQLDKTCFFASPHQGYRSRLDVDSGMDGRYEPVPANVIAEIPKTAMLTSASVVRVFEEAPGYVMVNSNYEADGRISGQGESRVKAGGDFISGSSQVRVMNNSVGPPELARYRMPQRLFLKEPVDWNRVTLPVEGQVETVTALVRRYDFDRYLSVDTFAGRKHTGTILLQPVVLREDVGLNEECDANLRQQIADGETILR